MPSSKKTKKAVELQALEQLSPEKAAKERGRLLASMEDVSHCFPVRPLEGDYPLVSPNIYDARYRAPYITSRFFVAYKDENEETQVIREPMLLIETDGNLSIKKVYRA